MKLTTHYLQWYLRQQLNRLGFVGMLGVGLFVFCLALYFSALVPLRAEVSAFQLETERKKAGHQRAIKPSDLPAAQLNAFYQNFPKLSRLPDVVESLNRVANEQGVVLEHGEYRQLPVGADELIRYEMTLPIRSDYLRLRAFVSNLLVEWPNMSVDSLAFERQKVNDTVLDAQIKLTVFFLER